MKKIALIMLAGLALLCSCEKKLSDDGLAMRLDKVPGTYIKESQLGATRKYAEAEFMEKIEGRCYQLVGIYGCYRKGGNTYYVIVREDDDGYIFNEREGVDGYGIHVRLFENDVMKIWAGPHGYTRLYLYDYSFDDVSQELIHGENGEYIPFFDDEYLVIQEFGTSALVNKDVAMFSRTVYQRTEPSDWFALDTIDLRGYFD